MTEVTDQGIIAPDTSAEPKFKSCWADDEREVAVVCSHGVTFTMRSITVGENQRINQSLGLEYDHETGLRQPKLVADIQKLMLFTVTAALGAWKKFGHEGWSDPRPVTPEAVEALKEETVSLLYGEYVRYFRAD